MAELQSFAAERNLRNATVVLESPGGVGLVGILLAARTPH